MAPREMLGLGSVDTAALGAPEGVLPPKLFPQVLRARARNGKKKPRAQGTQTQSIPTHPLMWAGERALELTDW